MVLSDFNYQSGVILVNIFAVFFLVGSFLSTGLRDRIIFKSDLSKEDHDHRTLRSDNHAGAVDRRDVDSREHARLLRQRYHQGAHFGMTRLSPSALTRNPSGYVVSVLGVDCVQLSASALQFPLPIIGSFCMPVVLWVLALRAGTVPAVGCAVWLMIVLFLPFPTSVLQNILWKRVMRYRDERLKSTADLLSSVRVVKLYAWEDAYLGTVGRLRDAELAALLRTNLLDGLMDSLYSSTSSLARDPLLTTML
ncbi:hypothetical protein MTO96_018807 [Rhipicephalus appendiculatus]